MHTNHTSNFELSQFISTDKPTFLGDYNGDMQKIDTAIAGVGVTATGADIKADSAITAANSAASTAADAATLANTANTNANSALATAGNAATAASAAQSTADGAVTAAATADAKAVTADGKADAASAKAGDLTQLTTTAKTDLVAAINEVNAKPSGGGTAASITYDNTTSGLTATDVQAAIDELKALIPTTPEYITTGLVIDQGRVIINDGGYYIDSNNIVHVDITVTAAVQVGGFWGVVAGFPQSTATTTGTITAEFNGMAMAYDSTNNSTFLENMTQIAAGTTIHFIGSYQLKTT